jgi:hypothetical protein
MDVSNDDDRMTQMNSVRLFSPAAVAEQKRLLLG